MKKVLTLLLVFVLGFSLASCTNEEDALNAADAAQKLSLEVSDPLSVTSNIELVLAGLHESTITWASNNEAVIAADGTVTRPAIGSDDVVVVLTATVTVGDESVDKDFSFKVLAAVPSKAVTIAKFESADVAMAEVVELTGVVVGLVKTYGYQIYDGTGFAYVNEFVDPTVNIGDNVTVMGEKGSFNNNTELVEITNTVVNSTGNDIPEFKAIDFDDIYAQDETTTNWYNDMFNMDAYVMVKGEYDNVYLVWFDQELNLIEMEIYYKSWSADKIAELTALEGKKANVDFILKDYYNMYRGTVNTTGEVVEETIFQDVEKAKLALAYNTMFFDGLADELILSLDLPEVSALLPTVEFTYSSSDETLIAADGSVTLPVGANEDVDFTITAKSGAFSTSKTYTLTVRDANNVTPISVSDALLLEDGSSEIVAGVVTAVMPYGNTPGTHIQDATGAGLFVEGLVDGVMSGDSIVVQGSLDTEDSYDNDRRQLSGGVLVNVVSSGNALVVNAITDPAVLAGAMLTNYSNVFTMTLTHEGTNYGNYDFIGAGTIDVVLKDDFFPTLEDYLDANSAIEITFVLDLIDYKDARIVPIAFPGLLAADALAIVEALVDPGTPLLEDVELMTEVALFDAVITWASDNAAIDATTGVVTRPAIDAGDAAVNLTASISIGGATAVDKVFAVVVTDMPAAPDTVNDLFTSGYDMAYPNSYQVYVAGVVAGLTDKGYVLQDTVSGKLVSVIDSVNTPAVGDEIAVDATFKADYSIIKLTDLTTYEVLSSGNALNLAMTNAVAVDFANFDLSNFQTGELIKVEAPWVKHYSGGTSYARLGNTEASVNDKSFDGKHFGLQNGANELNLTGTLADTFTGGDTPTEYATVTLYVFLYDSTSSYNKVVILDDSFIVVTPAS